MWQEELNSTESFCQDPRLDAFLPPSFLCYSSLGKEFEGSQPMVLFMLVLSQSS